ITIADNGPGLPDSVIDGVLDFSSRISSREAYAEPARGAQGNALKTILAVPFVLSGDQGTVEIATGGKRHVISVRVDQVRQQPVIDHEVEEGDFVKTGTSIKVDLPSSLDDQEHEFLQIVGGYTALNPHATFRTTIGGQSYTDAATDPSWRKWTPREP